MVLAKSNTKSDIVEIIYHWELSDEKNAHTGEK